MDRRGFIAGMLALLAAPLSAEAQQAAVEDLVTARGTIVGREPSPGAWVLELDRGVETSAGRVRTLRLQLDESRGPAHPILVGDRLEVEGRLVRPTLPDTLTILEPTRVEHLADPGLKHAYFLFWQGKSKGCAECYIPLLLTAMPIGASTTAPEAEVIVTFERDSNLGDPR